MNEPILPKSWYGNTVNVTFEENPVVTVAYTLMDTNAQGILLMNDDGSLVFYPWRLIVSVEGP